MPLQVTASATIKCSFGAAPTVLNVISPANVMADKLPAATVMDMVPIKNIPSFSMCNSLANPTVASATAAASGVLTPMPCMPVIAGPWAPGSTKVKIGGLPALTNTSKCMCNWGGVIEIVVPGSTTVQPA